MTDLTQQQIAHVPLSEKPEPNPEWEAKAEAFPAALLAECGVEPEQTLKMLERWKADAEPANEQGQVTFSRAMLDSATDAIRLLIAERERLREALAFAACAIKCGDEWTETCERVIGGALHGRKALGEVSDDK